MKNLKYFGNYLGIVVQNNDPERRGRVKVFVPSITPSVYKGWNEVKKDKKFKFIGTNINSDLTDILDDLRKILPWADCAAPLMGESSSGLFNNSYQAGTISDSNKLTQAISNKTSSETNESDLTDYSQNKDNIGEKPANLYDSNLTGVNDAFNRIENNNNVNRFSFNYKPDSYSNGAKGAFSIPRVGSHLWVFFHAGDPLFPVFFAASYGQSDWSSIYDTASGKDLGIDYPGSFENKKEGDSEKDNNIETYRNKFVINQKGGTLSFVNTDNKEALKLTHYAGGFKEFNNFTNIEFAPKNDQKLVLEDSFSTVRGSRNEYTEGDKDSIIKGNFYKKIGSLNKDVFEEWKSVVNELADIKQMFDINRCGRDSSSSYKGTSTYQKKTGNNGPCPVCSPDITKMVDYFTIINNSFNSHYQDNGLGIDPNFKNIFGDMAYGISLQGKKKQLFYPGTNGTPYTTYAGTVITATVDGTTASSSRGEAWGIKCPTCNGTGLSPSSKDGTFDLSNKSELIKGFFNRNLKKLSDIENKMGLGGSEIVDITKHKIETIGTVMNDFGSIRIDTKGRIGIADVRVGKYATFYNRQATPIIEYVNVDDLPGGNFTLSVCNRYNILVGAGGLNMKSYGPVNIGGTITNVGGSQINIASENEINIDGGKRFSVIADIINIRQRNKKQIVVESNLGVTNNVIIAGGAYIEGEVYLQHVTAPAEWQRTEGTELFGAAAVLPGNIGGKIIGFGVPLSNLASFSTSSKGTTKFLPGLGAKVYLGKTDFTKIIGRTTSSDQIGHIKIGDIQIDMNPLSPNYGKNTNIVTVYGGTGSADCLAIYGSDVDCIVGSNQGAGGADASKMPIVVYGTGRDEDSIYIGAHTHLFKNLPLTLKNLNKEVREEAVSNKLHESVPVGSSPVNNSKK